MNRDKYFHYPVMKQSILEYLNPQKNKIYLDATLGLGGHSLAVLQAAKGQCQIIGLDQDPESIKIAKSRLKKYQDRVRLIHSNFSALDQVLSDQGIKQIDGAIFDLGTSTFQLQQPEYGLSFQRDTSLDMRLDRQIGQSVSELINEIDQTDLEKIIRDLAEEKKIAKRLAVAICHARLKEPILTTHQLVKIIEGVSPKYYGRKIHPATNIFRALRMAVNHELENLEAALPKAVKILSPGGRLAVISFHSLEDRLVKHFFQKEAKECLCPPKLPQCVCNHHASIKIITKKPIIPTDEEIKNNPPSRSAKLRVVEKIENCE